MQIVTCKLPGWIKCEGRDKVGKRVINEGKLVLDEAGAKAVRQIFALASDGYGASTIAQRLNAENVPVLGRKEIAARGQAHFPPDERKKRPVVWSGAVVWHILKSRATIGEYIPYGRRKDGSVGTAVPDYFPAVIDADTFHAVNGAIQTRGRVGHGRRGKHVNLFAGLLRDARDDGSLSYWHTGTHDPVLISVNAKEGRGVRWVSFPAKVFEEAILSRLVEIKPSDIWGDGGNKAAKKVAAIADRIAKNESLAKLWTSKMDNPDTVDLVAAKLAELIAERKALAAEQEEAQRELASPISESWGEFATLAGLLKSDQSDELRLRFRSSLRRTIQEIHCLFVKQGYTSLAAVQVNFAKDEGRRNYLIISRRPTVNGTARTPVRWWAGSIKHPDDDLPFEKEDLRNPDEAAGVEAFLKAYPRDMIDKLLSGKPARKPARR